ncbi:alpha/beta hydrolase family protein [Chitinophaga sp. RAB17]|uniref:alpha/beta hydrolase family protein n=1 Tax=Chitinophaga sp. RAB17 TaxID=3233049 RepID=UPI003F933D5C
MTFSQWPSVTEGCISSNRDYVSYLIENQPTGGRTGVIGSLRSNWKAVVSGISGPITFAPNSQFALWINLGDSLGVIRLGSSIVSFIPSVGSYEIKGRYIIYRPKDIVDDLVIKNIITSKTVSYSSVKTYKVSNNCKSLVLLQTVKNAGEIVQVLNVVGLETGKINTVWRGWGATKFIVDEYGDKMAFITVDKDSERGAIWLAKLTSAFTARCIVTDSLIGAGHDLRLASIQKFSKKGDLIFITLREKEKIPASPLTQKMVKLDIWNFNDHKLQTHQLSDPVHRDYAAVVKLNSSIINQLEYRNECLVMPAANVKCVSDTSVLIKAQENDGKGGEVKWNVTCKVYWYLVSTIDGSRTPLDFIDGNMLVEISPGGKYIIYYDSKQENYFSYEIATKMIKNITRGVDEVWEDNFNSEFYRYRSVAAWGEGDAFLVIYGQHDIWKIAPSGIASPICLTNKYGQTRNIVFSLALEEYSHRYILSKEILILTAFNQKTKENGFYQKKINLEGNPDSLLMESRIYNIINSESIQSTYGFNAERIKRVKKFIVKRMSASEAPNYFSTTDFRTFRPLSDLHPEKMYNWYTSELHTWKTSSQTVLQGILYKPENFDSTKKYPVIFHYYERESDGLNAYLAPEALSGFCSINIPYFTSNGYLVFCPDIHYTIGDPMRGAFESVISAASYLSQLPFVNANRMALQGCSWGGIQTNYFVTQTNLFAAACSSSSIADWISGYGSLLSYGASLQGMYESGQFRMGGTLWERTFYYMKSSPVLFADRISTPILLMHTKDDGICPFSNILEFFIALRRLGKRSWMLVYDGNHGLYGKEAEDFSIRMKQFFDHYLMDSLPPVWMTAGIQARFRGIKSGLELDSSIRTPEPNLIRDKSKSLEYESVSASCKLRK